MLNGQQDKPAIINVMLSWGQVEALMGLIDAGTRATGIRAVKDAALLVDIFEKAVQAAIDLGKEKPNEVKNEKRSADNERSELNDNPLTNNLDS